MKDAELQERWQQELLAMHRWGRFAFWFNREEPEGKRELARLRGLWEEARPLDEPAGRLLEQVMALEICNWRLEESILDLCAAIGRRQPSPRGIGHLSSMTPERWRVVWSYYLSLRRWLAGQTGAYAAMLSVSDTEAGTEGRIGRLLGDASRLKQAYVERLCLALERWLGNYQPESLPMLAHNAAVAAAEAEIVQLDPGREVVPEAVFASDGDGRLQPCSHKALYRYDLIISSIGAGRWRAAMGRRLTDGLARADVLEKHLAPVELWVQGRGAAGDEPGARIAALLGERDSVKVFPAALLVSLLRPQQLAARELAQRRGEAAKTR